MQKLKRTKQKEKMENKTCSYFKQGKIFYAYKFVNLHKVKAFFKFHYNLV